jgi:hypothetical protein
MIINIPTKAMIEEMINKRVRKEINEVMNRIILIEKKIYMSNEERRELLNVVKSLKRKKINNQNKGNITEPVIFEANMKSKLKDEESKLKDEESKLKDEESKLKEPQTYNTLENIFIIKEKKQ